MNQRTPEQQFCPFCGAGKGEFRRLGEGTCEQCDPEGVAANRARTSNPDDRAEIHRLTTELAQLQAISNSGRNIRRAEIEHYRAALKHIHDATGGNGLPFANKWARGVAEMALRGPPDEPSGSNEHAS